MSLFSQHLRLFFIAAKLTWCVNPVGVLVGSYTHPVDYVLGLISANLRDSHQTGAPGTTFGWYALV
jgi:hypothetical protein